MIRMFKPSPALAVSFVALVVALGGTSYAALSLPRNSVGTKQIVNGAVTARKIRNGAVTAAKIDTAGLTVPNALHSSSANAAVNAMNATSAGHASAADSATTADHASTADNATTATTAIDAETLAGDPPSSFESARDIITAVVTNDGTKATVVRAAQGGNPIATRSGSGVVNVFFGQSIADCTPLTTAVAPLGGISADVEAAAGNEVTVITSNTSGAEVDANFNLLVVC
jgi:hypothetical protein